MDSIHVKYVALIVVACTTPVNVVTIFLTEIVSCSAGVQIPVSRHGHRHQMALSQAGTQMQLSSVYDKSPFVPLHCRLQIIHSNPFCKQQKHVPTTLGHSTSDSHPRTLPILTYP